MHTYQHIPIRPRLETMAMTEKQQERLRVCENNWVKKIAGVKESKAKNGGAEGGSW